MSTTLFPKYTLHPSKNTWSKFETILLVFCWLNCVFINSNILTSLLSIFSLSEFTQETSSSDVLSTSGLLVKLFTL